MHFIFNHVITVFHSISWASCYKIGICPWLSPPGRLFRDLRVLGEMRTACFHNPICFMWHSHSLTDVHKALGRGTQSWAEEKSMMFMKRDEQFTGANIWVWRRGGGGGEESRRRQSDWCVTVFLCDEECPSYDRSVIAGEDRMFLLTLNKNFKWLLKQILGIRYVPIKQ